MAKPYDNAKERKEAVQKFEQMLRNNALLFFESHEYEYIISHYLDKGQWKQALKACDLAIAQYPYSILFLLDKASVLAHKRKFQDAHDLLDFAENIQPGEIDIVIARSHLFMQEGDLEKNLSYLTYVVQQNSEPETLYFQIALAYRISLSSFR
jgi:tetratricopeptide (TPR) repeat protein